jgi:hypothetical protein
VRSRRRQFLWLGRKQKLSNFNNQILNFSPWFLEGYVHYVISYFYFLYNPTQLVEIRIETLPDRRHINDLPQQPMSNCKYKFDARVWHTILQDMLPQIALYMFFVDAQNTLNFQMASWEKEKTCLLCKINNRLCWNGAQLSHQKHGLIWYSILLYYILSSKVWQLLSNFSCSAQEIPS